MDTRNLETRTTSILVDYLTKQNRILETLDEDNRDKIKENIKELSLIIEDKLKIDYLFSWDKIPGNDSGRLKEFLEQNFSIDWIKTAKIEKIDDNKTIIVSAEKNSLSLRLNDEKNKVNLTIDNDRTDEFVVKTENGKLNIYKIKKDTYYYETLKRLRAEPEDRGRQGALESVLKDVIDIDIEFKKDLGDLLAKIEGEPDYFVFFSCRHVDRCTRYNKDPAKIKDGCQGNIDELPCYYKNAIQKSFKEKFLFDWEDAGENDYNALRWYLHENAGIDWVKTASIGRINGQTIKISNTKDSLFLKLNDEKTTVKLQIDNGKTETFNVKNENDKLKVYKINKIDIRFPTRDFKSIDDALKKMDSMNGKNCFFVLNSHRPINEFTYFQLGYAFAKGIEVLRLNEGMEQFLPEDMKLSSKICQTENLYEFITKILEFSQKKENENRKCRKDYWNRPKGCWPTGYDNGSMQIPTKN